MNWLIAIIHPHALLRPGYVRNAETISGAEGLAALVAGDPWQFEVHEARIAYAGDAAALQAVSDALMPETIRDGVARLFALVEGGDADWAKRVALALVLAVSAAEIEESERTIRLLRELAERVLRRRDEDSKILGAALLLQIALREQDFGSRPSGLHRRAAGLLFGLDVRKITPVVTRDGETIDWGAILAALLSAAGSFPYLDDGQRDQSPVYPRSARVDDLIGMQAAGCGDFLTRRFQERTGSRTRYFGGQGKVDMFHVLLGFELLGHSAVYSVRAQLAQLRLVQSQPQSDADASELADVLRLLRQAGAKAELDLALTWLRLQGPLAALGEDARKVLSRRSARPALRVPELQVLQVAADLLTQGEALAGFRAVEKLVQNGPPVDLPGQWESEATRLEAGWLAAVALADVCGRTDAVLALLAEQASEMAKTDALTDIGLARALQNVNWLKASQGSRDLWGAWGSTTMPEGLRTRDVLVHADVPHDGREDLPLIDHLVHKLNRAMRAGPIQSDVTAEEIALLRDQLANAQGQAAQQVFSMGQFDVADLTAGIIVYLGVASLWPDLAAFLLNPAVQRDDKSAAFDRLAASDLSLGADVSARFESTWTDVAAASGAFWGEPINPYPEALRFWAAHGLLGSEVVAGHVEELAASPRAEVRVQAARTVEVISRRRAWAWLPQTAMRLSFDVDAIVRGRAGYALCVIAKRKRNLESVPAGLLQRLLLEDGLVVPLQVLLGLEHIPTLVPPSLLATVADLAALHPSQRIRAQAVLVARGEGLAAG